MNVLILGNSGSGKTTLARQLAQTIGAPTLSMDQVAFLGGTERALLADSVEQLQRFLTTAENGCIIEGCYGDLTAAVAPQIDVLLLLNPGIGTCLAHCAERPWEPDKFESPEAQEAMRATLLEWVARYEDREDEYGYRCHREVFEAFTGHKLELEQPDVYLRSALQLVQWAPPQRRDTE